MKRKINDSNNVQTFLEREGVLASDDREQIDAAKRKYWAMYRREWNKRKRLEHQTFEIFLSKKEHAVICKGAARCNTSATHFIKQAALAKGSDEHLVNPAFIARMRQGIVLTCTDLLSMVEDGELPNLLANRFIQRIEECERQLLIIIAETQ